MALITLDYHSQCLSRTVTVNVVLPADKVGFPELVYEEPRDYKVLVLLHGIVGNCSDWLRYSNVARWATEKNLVVVMPSGDNHFYVDNAESGEKYGEFVGQELVEMVRRMFRLTARREDTFIAGLSMGGYGALVNGLKYRKSFSRIGAFSPALLMEQIAVATDDAPLPMMRKSYYRHIFGDLGRLCGSDKDYNALAETIAREKDNSPSIYLSCGSEDEFVGASRKYYRLLQSLGLDCVYEESPGGHEWDFWNSTIQKFLAWLPADE